MDAFKGDLDEHLKDYPKQLTRGIGEMIEVLPPGSSKAVGLEALLKEVGIPAEEVMMANILNIYPFMMSGTTSSNTQQISTFSVSCSLG